MRTCRSPIRANLGLDALISAAMTTPPGQDPRPGPTRGVPARPIPRGADSGWAAGSPQGRGTGQGRGPDIPGAGGGQGRDDADPGRGGSAAGTGGRNRGPARADADPWQDPGAPERGQNVPNRGSRGGAGRDWGARPASGGAVPGRANQPGDRSGTAPGWSRPDSSDRAGSAPGWDGQRTGGRAPGRRAAGWQGGPRPAGAGRGYPDTGGQSLRGDRGRRRADYRGPEDRAEELTQFRSGSLGWIGLAPTRVGIYILIGAALLGVIGTLLTGSEPGSLLGIAVIAGSVIAALVIRRRSVYLLIPLPALTLFLTAVLTGAVKDSSIDTNTAQLGVSFLQWIAFVFFPICAATILVVVITGARWLLSRQFVTGQFQMSGGRGGSERGPRADREAGPRADRDRRSARDGDPWGAVGTRNDIPGGQRTNRGQLDPRDPWGDRRGPTGRQPSDRTQPGSRPGPGDRTLPPNRTPPPNRSPGGQRPNRDPRDPWDQRLPRETTAFPAARSAGPGALPRIRRRSRSWPRPGRRTRRRIPPCPARTCHGSPGRLAQARERAGYRPR